MSNAVLSSSPADDHPSAERILRVKLEKSATMELTRANAIAAAKAHQELPASPTERDFSMLRCKELLKRLEAGCWLPCNWATVKFNGVKYRMNGMHSSWVMVNHGELLPDIKVAIHVDHYIANSRDEMALLFQQFDARFSSRSTSDVAGAYQGLVSELDGVMRKRAKLAIDGAAWFMRSIEGLPVPSDDQRYDLFFQPRFLPWIKWVDALLEPWKKTGELHGATVVAAMYGTFLKSESGADEFWPQVAKGNLPDDSDARQVLSSELNNINEKKDEATPVQVYAKCVKAWNAFRSGDKIKSLNVNVKKGLPEIAA